MLILPAAEETASAQTPGLVTATGTTGALQVREGSSASYTVRLATQPTGDVTVAIGGTSGTDLSLDETSLTFTTTNWNTDQTVTVSAAEDDDAANDAETLTHTASGGGYASVTANVAVSVTDNDTASLVVAPPSLRVRGGGSASYTVRLATQPTADVTVAISGTSGTALSLDKTSLTFTTTNWNTNQTVTVSATEGNFDGLVNWSLVHTASGGGYASVTESVAVAARFSTPRLLLTPTARLTVTEGSSASLAVRLSRAPRQTTTLSLYGFAGKSVSLDKTSLTFTATNWNMNQTVTVSATEDVDTANDAFFLIFEGFGLGNAGQIRMVVIDNDASSVVLTSTSQIFAEPSSSEPSTTNIRIRLSTQPSEDVTVTVTGHAGTDVGVTPTSWTFTPSNWDDWQDVRLAASADDDRVDDSVTLSFTASDYVTATMTVTVRDNLLRPLDVQPGTLRVVEGSTASFLVRLPEQPSADVTVSIGGTSGTDLSLDKTSLTFTPSGWNAWQSVSVSAAEDDDLTDDLATLSFTPSGSGFLTTSRQVRVPDNDAPALLVAPSLTVDEGGTAGYSVRLTTQPSATVTVAISGHSGTDLSLDKTSLTFTTTSWSDEQTVTVSAAQDDDAADDTATLTHTASGGDYASVTADVAVRVTDDDTPGLVFSPTSLTVAEGGEKSYTVKLATQPSASVTVSVGGTSGTDLSLDETSLTFSASNWSTTQTVTVSAGQDDDASNDSATLTHTASGGGYASVTGDVGVTVTDDDTAGLVFSPTSLTVAEGGEKSYTVKLATQPSSSVTVSVGGTSGTDLSLDETSLTFSTSNWSTTQTVTVSAGQDDDASNDSATLTHTASGGGYASVTGDVGVTVTDDDTPGLVFSPTSLTVAEGGEKSYTVKLATQPSSSVTVSVGGTSGTDLSLDETSLTFSTSNWSTTQTVTVSAGQDDDASNDSATLTHTASGGDYASVTGDVGVTVTDDDTPGLVFSPTSLTVAEGGNGSYTVKLATQPTASVTVAVSGHSGTDLSLDETSLTFSTTNWSTTQTVTVSAGQDDDASNDSATLMHTASGGDYASVTGSLTVNTTDNDTAGLVLSTATLAVNEGGNASYTVALATQPTASVTVAIGGTSGTDLSLDETSLTFSTTNWNTTQTVTVSAGQDDDASNDSATLMHTASGGDYASVTGSLTVNTTDNDTAGLVLSTATLAVNEGATRATRWRWRRSRRRR